MTTTLTTPMVRRVPRHGWDADAACRADPETWWTPALAGAAIHVCLAHCPVLDDCTLAVLAAPLSRRPNGGVQAARWWPERPGYRMSRPCLDPHPCRRCRPPDPPDPPAGALSAP